ncbi:peptidylprolyl isomerase [Flammeovirgaceae bacterium SG7u.111]|nr:peptidylprolyl isomerase [Flammeovirgaceae bacterium SG7u.132]WPO34102.1 peptidylprolyl isomerase [Flammeovirgaceae bacterium SG7u.111]
MSVKVGDKIKVHYVGTFNDGEVFDSSVARSQPLEFTVGDGSMIKGFDEAVRGMTVEEKKKVAIIAKEAYGEASDDNVVSFPLTSLPEGMNPNIGDQLMLNNQGQQIPVVVKGKTDTEIILDANHPMAGKDLNFEIEVVEIVG